MHTLLYGGSRTTQEIYTQRMILNCEDAYHTVDRLLQHLYNYVCQQPCAVLWYMID